MERGARKYMTAKEKLLLCDIISKYKAIIENKKSDCVSVSQKNGTWIKITQEFNSDPDNNPKTTAQLVKAWDNMKVRRRKEITLEKRERMATGGGVFKPPVDNDPVDSVLNIVDVEIPDALDSDMDHIDLNIEMDTGQVLLSLSEATSKDKNDNENKENQPETPQKRPETMTPHLDSSKKLSRGTAIEKELEVRIQRTKKLLEQDEKLHKLKIIEQIFKVIKSMIEVERERLQIELVKLQLDQIKKK